jgi:serine/threonine protein kinase
MEETLVTEIVGSPLCMPPEMLLKSPYNPFQADIWAFGILAYELIFGGTPYANYGTMDCELV